MPQASITVQITANASGFIAGVNQAAQATQQLGGASTQLGQAVQQAGAHAANLGAGASQGGEHLKHLAEAAEQANEGMHRLGEGVRHAAELLGIGLGVKEAIEGLERLAEMGERMENIAAAIGMPVEEFAKLSGAMQLTGGNAETARRSLILLDSKLTEAAVAPSKARSALIALGYSMEDIKKSSEDSSYALTRLAEAYTQWANTPEKAALFKELLGARGMQELIAAIKGGPEEFEKLKKAWLELTGLTEPVIKHLAETAEGINRFKAALLGVGVSIYEEFRDPINKAIENLTEFAKHTDDVKAKLDELGGAVSGGYLGARIGALFGPWGALIGTFVGGIGGAVVGINTLGEKFGWLAGKIKDAVDWWRELAGLEEDQATKEAKKVVPLDARGEEAFRRRQEGQREYESQMAPLRESAGLSGVELPTYEEWLKSLPAEQRQKYLPEPPKPPETPFGGEGSRTREHEEGGPAAKPGVPTPVDETQEKKKLDLAVKLNQDELNAKRAYYELLKAQANGNRQAIAQIEQQEVEDLQKTFAAKRKIWEDELVELKKRTTDQQTIEQIVPPSKFQELDTEERRLQIQKTQVDNAAKNDAARDAIKELEAARKRDNEQEAADLRSVERSRSIGQVTAAAAAAAEEQIVRSHADRVAKILAQEAEQAQGQKELMREVADRAAEEEQRKQNQIRDIQERAQEEEVKRAKEIDKELAGSLADAIMNVSIGKETWGQAIQKFFEAQEKKLLEKSLQKLFDASGIGKELGDLGDLLGFGESGSKDPNVALRTATADNTSATRANTAALDKFKPGAGGAGVVTGTGGGGTGGGAAYAPATGPYADLINNAAAQYNVPPGILYNLIGAESSFNPNEQTGNARGLAQFTPETAKQYGVDVTSASSSIFGAAHYLADLFAKMGSWTAALGAYSGQGPGLGTYAGQKNPYGPALVASAQQADRGPTTATMAAAQERYTSTLDLAHGDLKTLDAILREASRSLPEGYRAEATSGYRPGATVANTGQPSLHAEGEAIDVRIVGPEGAVKNVGRGPGTPEYDIYKQYAVAAYNAGQRVAPGFELGWGGNFRSGVPLDLMHFQRGDTGAGGSLRAEAEAAKEVGGTGAPGTGVDVGLLRSVAGGGPIPVNVAQVGGSSTSSDGVPVAPASSTSMQAYFDKAGPLYAQASGGASLQGDIQSAQAGGLGAVVPYGRLKSTIGGNAELKQLWDQAAADYKTQTQHELMDDLRSGKKLEDILAVGTQSASAGDIPQFAEGGPVDETGLAMVHQGEYVVPADQSSLWGDFQQYLTRSWQHLKEGASGIGQAFVGTAQGYNAQVQGIQDAANTGVPLPAEDMAGFVAQHMLGGAPANSLSSGIRAFHGSPYDFDAFDASKIGTGEGAQARGHGLYFAEAEPVALEYKNRLAGKAPPTIDRAPLGELEDWQSKELDAIESSLNRETSAWGPIGLQAKVAERRAGGDQRTADWLRQIGPQLQTAPSKGRMYEVGINAEPEHFVDWDKPLTDQPQIAQKLLDAGVLQHPQPPAWLDVGQGASWFRTESPSNWWGLVTPDQGQFIGWLKNRSEPLGRYASIDEARAAVEGGLPQEHRQELSAPLAAGRST